MVPQMMKVMVKGELEERELDYYMHGAVPMPVMNRNEVAVHTVGSPYPVIIELSEDTEK